MLENGFDTNIQTVVNRVLKDIMVTEITTPLPVRIFGEIFGGSVQDLKYGMTSSVFRVFDVQVGYNFVSRKIAEHICLCLGLQMLPILYSGPFDMDAIVAVRDGKTVIGGDNVREGVVVTSHSPEHHHVHGRRICKFISPDYLLRKVKSGEPTEFT